MRPLRERPEAELRRAVYDAFFGVFEPDPARIIAVAHPSATYCMGSTIPLLRPMIVDNQCPCCGAQLRSATYIRETLPLRVHFTGSLPNCGVYIVERSSSHRASLARDQLHKLGQSTTLESRLQGLFRADDARIVCHLIPCEDLQESLACEAALRWLLSIGGTEFHGDSMNLSDEEIDLVKTFHCARDVLIALIEKKGTNWTMAP